MARNSIIFAAVIIAAALAGVIVTGWIFADEIPVKNKQQREIRRACVAALGQTIGKKRLAAFQKTLRRSCRCAARRYARRRNLRGYYGDQLAVWWRDLFQFNGPKMGFLEIFYQPYFKTCRPKQNSGAASAAAKWWRDYLERLEEQRPTDINPYSGSDDRGGTDSRGRDRDLD